MPSPPLPQPLRRHPRHCPFPDKYVRARTAALRRRSRVQTPVPRYYFNVCCDAFETTDISGETCSDDVAALGEALRLASGIMRRQLREGGLGPHGWIEVEDERHRSVMKLPLRAAAY